MKNLVTFVILLSSVIVTSNAKSLIGELLDIFFADLDDLNEHSEKPSAYQGQNQLYQNYIGQNQQYAGIKGQNQLYQNYLGQNQQYQGYNQGYSQFPMYSQGN